MKFFYLNSSIFLINFTIERICPTMRLTNDRRNFVQTSFKFPVFLDNAAPRRSDKFRNSTPQRSSAVPTSINPELFEPLPRGLNLGTMLIGVSYRGPNYRPPGTVSIRLPTIRSNSSNVLHRMNAS